MFIDKDSIKVKINGMANYLSLGQYLLDVKYGYNKLWASDTGRNLAGKMSGTLIGIFPKLTLHFRHLTRAELETITPILDAENQSLQYYDPTLRTTKTITTYTGDYEIENVKIINGNRKNKGFTCAFISVAKR